MFLFPSKHLFSLKRHRLIVVPGHATNGLYASQSLQESTITLVVRIKEGVSLEYRGIKMGQICINRDQSSDYRPFGHILVVFKHSVSDGRLCPKPYIHRQL